MTDRAGVQPCDDVGHTGYSADMDTAPGQSGISGCHDAVESRGGIRYRLSLLSYRSGLLVAGICVVCYAVSFAQMLLPLPVAVKGGLWVVFFGLAKTAQYAALLILGKAGIEKLRKVFRKK